MGPPRQSIPNNPPAPAGSLARGRGNLGNGVTWVHGLGQGIRIYCRLPLHATESPRARSPITIDQSRERRKQERPPPRAIPALVTDVASIGGQGDSPRRAKGLREASAGVRPSEIDELRALAILPPSFRTSTWAGFCALPAPVIPYPMDSSQYPLRVSPSRSKFKVRVTGSGRGGNGAAVYYTAPPLSGSSEEETRAP